MTGCPESSRENYIKISNFLSGDGKIALFLKNLYVVVLSDLKMAVCTV